VRGVLVRRFSISRGGRRAAGVERPTCLASHWRAVSRRRLGLADMTRNYPTISGATGWWLCAEYIHRSTSKNAPRAVRAQVLQQVEMCAAKDCTVLATIIPSCLPASSSGTDRPAGTVVNFARTHGIAPTSWAYSARERRSTATLALLVQVAAGPIWTGRAAVSGPPPSRSRGDDFGRRAITRIPFSRRMQKLSDIPPEFRAFVTAVVCIG